MLKVHTNAGTFETKQVAKLPWQDIEVWYDPHSITNVLSFAIMVEHFEITYENDIFDIHTPKGVIKFKQIAKNLYVFVPEKIEARVMIQTLE